MRIGIVGLAQAGKKTLFKLLTGADAPAHHGKGDFPVGVGAVPDERVGRLAAVYKPKKTKLAEIEWVLFPALPADEKARRDWFDRARETDGLCYVTRQFSDASVYHEEGSVDPARDVAKLDLELAFADLTVVETRLDRLAKDTAKKTAAEREKQVAVLTKLKAAIEDERPLRGIELDKPELDRLSGLKFLSRKACMVVLNVDEDLAGDEAKLGELAASISGHRDHRGKRDSTTQLRGESPSSEFSVPSVANRFSAQGREIVCLSAKIEAEVALLDDAAERAEFLSALGLSEAGPARIAQAALDALGLITFLTGNRNEVGAHLVRRGAAAPEAAGVVHTDFESGFIRAEVMKLDDLVAAGSEAKLREQGKVATKGKDYVVREGDIMHILANA